MRRLALVLLLVFSLPVFCLAEEINFNHVVVDQDGQAMPTCSDGAPCTDKSPITLRIICLRALAAVFSDEQNLGGDEKFKRGELALRIYRSTAPISLTVEEKSLLKKLIGRAFGPMVVVDAWNVLEGKH
jgi:hypothetical protein